MAFNTNETLNGTDGRLWINDTPCLTVQSFTFHQTNVWEDTPQAGVLTKPRRLVGVELTGTINKYKVDNTIVSLMQDYKDGEMPEIKLIGLMQNPATSMMQRAVIKGVTLGELDLLNFEQKTVAKEEIPFEATDYYYQDLT